MKVALDALGGDKAPSEIVKGAVEACRDYDLEVVLIGEGAAFQQELAKYDTGGLKLSTMGATEAVGGEESPTAAFRLKKGSSIAVGMNLLKGGEAQALVSAGNTGAIVTAALLILGRMEGIKRPALGALLAPPSGPTILVDAGANADCKPSFLLQFAYLGSAYMESVLDIKSPRVGLLSIGEEEIKGNQLARETFQLLKESGLDFVGNVEGNHLLKGMADVVVTDGFTGNVIIKLIEGLNEVYMELWRQILTSAPSSRLASFLLKPRLRSLAKRLDYAEYGGLPLLGVKGNVLIAHGRSNAKAIKSALRLAHQAAAQGLLEKVMSSRTSSSVDL